jgi:hypothetical protein
MNSKRLLNQQNSKRKTPFNKGLIGYIRHNSSEVYSSVTVKYLCTEILKYSVTMTAQVELIT